MKRAPLILAAIGALALVGPASAAAPQGYLDPASLPDMVKVLPKPPKPGSVEDRQDLKAFKATRALEGSPRWAMAQQDNKGSPDDAFQDFACALGVKLDAASAPVLHAMLARAMTDARNFVDPAKIHYARPRPFLRLKGDICIPRTDSLAKSGSYPSGHSTASWAWGLILADLAPDRATGILERARAYSESRVVCGVHYPSDIANGRLNGSALFAMLESSPEFRADMEKARAEVAAARAAGGPKPDPAVCKVEAEAEAHRPW